MSESTIPFQLQCFGNSTSWQEGILGDQIETEIGCSRQGRWTYLGSFIRPTTSERAASSSHDSGDVRNLPPDYLSSELILIHGVFAGPLAATILSVIHAVSGVFLHSSTIQGRIQSFMDN